MIALLQRVRRAQVEIGRERIAVIGAGLLVLVGVQSDDNEAAADRLLERLLGYRVFADADGKMNLNIKQDGNIPSGQRFGYSSTDVI